MVPMGRAPRMQAKSFLFLRRKTRLAPRKFATGPRATSWIPSQRYAFPTKHPRVTPAMTGQPKRVAKGIRQSAKRS